MKNRLHPPFDYAPLRPDTIDIQLTLQSILSQTMPSSPLPSKIDWWDQAFPPVPLTQTPLLKSTMLYLVAYDISSPRRLQKIAKTCEDFGARVQYSLFECRLNPDHFHELWERLNDIIDPDEDRIVSYRLDSDNASKTLTAGTMHVTTPVVCYIV